MSVDKKSVLPDYIIGGGEKGRADERKGGREIPLTAMVARFGGGRRDIAWRQPSRFTEKC